MIQNEMFARMAIHHTMAVYNNAGDRGSIGDMMECFLDDAVLELSEGRYHGQAHIVQLFQGIKDQAYLSGPDQRPARHHITTSRIEFTSDNEAQGWTYYLLVRDGAIVQSGIYIDRFARNGERWLFSYRRVKVEFDTLPTRM